MADPVNGDVLQLILDAHALQAQIYSNPRVCGRWQGVHQTAFQASFHLIGEGSCWLHMRHLPQALELHSGDLALFPRDDWHILSSAPLARGEEVFYGDSEGPATVLICGEIGFQPRQPNPILDALPALVLVRQAHSSTELELVTRLLRMEVAHSGLGNLSVLNRLAETLFVLVVRQYLAGPERKQGLLAALADPRLNKALLAIHRSPETRWQVSSLAHVASMSRTVFAQRFAEVLEQTPIEYLTRWRMQLAQLWLREQRAPVTEVAKKLGYETETAFRRAFQRVTGLSPGRLRRHS